MKLVTCLRRYPNYDLLRIGIGVARLLRRSLLNEGVRAGFRVLSGIVFSEFLNLTSSPIRSICFRFQFNFEGRFRGFCVRLFVYGAKDVTRDHVPMILTQVFRNDGGRLECFDQFLNYWGCLRNDFPYLLLSNFDHYFLRFLYDFRRHVAVALSRSLRRDSVDFINADRFRHMANVLNHFYWR